MSNIQYPAWFLKLHSDKTAQVQQATWDKYCDYINKEQVLSSVSLDKLAVKPGDVMRVFETGATRNTEEGKLDYEGFLSPIVLERFAQYLHEHRIQADGKLRDSDNWTRGIPKAVYMKSLWRHFITLCKAHKGYKTDEDIQTALCAVMFNSMGYLFEVLHEQDSTGRAK